MCLVIVKGGYGIVGVCMWDFYVVNYGWVCVVWKGKSFLFILVVEYY